MTRRSGAAALCALFILAGCGEDEPALERVEVLTVDVVAECLAQYGFTEEERLQPSGIKTVITQNAEGVTLGVEPVGDPRRARKLAELMATSRYETHLSADDETVILTRPSPAQATLDAAAACT